MIDWVDIPYTRATWGMVEGANRFFVYLGYDGYWRAYDADRKLYIARFDTEAECRQRCEAVMANGL